MELILERGLPHQQKAIEAIAGVFENANVIKSVMPWQNKTIIFNDGTIAQNIKKVQQKFKPHHESRLEVSGNYLNLDVKMETGTGKTYVYTKAIYELNQRYGINKFIIAVPTLPIKAGTKNFIEDAYSKRHFAADYGTEIELFTVESVRKKNGRQFFPYAVQEFVKGSTTNSRKIYVLLLNMQMLGAKTLKTNYDSAVEGFYNPLQAIAATRPFVIIDEAHRFSREQAAFKTIVEKIKPQCIIRFGATFPEIAEGRGKSKRIVKDYCNLIYELDACDSFNSNLIKGVAKEHFEALSGSESKLKITGIARADKVNFIYYQAGKRPKAYSLGKDEALSVIDEAFEGLTITGITKNSVLFSNGLEKTQGEEMLADVYMQSYQEQMIKLALQRHFETEKENFCNANVKIKTLALFFIADIYSYRENEESGKEPYLKNMFERNLKEYLNKAINNCTDGEEEYKAYLEYSLNHIADCHAGYFAEDNDSSDDGIAKEVEDILHNKKLLLSFKNPDGSYNVRRFLFSKWTLKEGWDNPNVFTIAKLRSSGSENSKLQEVGRGLRLPVDENGNRVSDEQFYLNYIVDFTEADFAKKLVDEINGDRPQYSIITEAMLQQVAEKRNISADDLFSELFIGRFIDRHYMINPENRAELFEKYPEFAAGIKDGKIKDNNKTKIPKTIKVRVDKYNELKDLWQAVNRNYVIYYDNKLNEVLPEEIKNLLMSGDIFAGSYIQSSRSVLSSNIDGTMQVNESSGTTYKVDGNLLPYGEFLLRINRVTNIPVQIMHEAVVNYAGETGTQPREFTEQAVTRFIEKFNGWKQAFLQGRFNYACCSKKLKETVLNNADGSAKTVLPIGRVGTKFVEGSTSSKYLYDIIAYDSPLEKENITGGDIAEIVVYGKIPNKSIAIPTIAGGTYSPDFMYVVKKDDGSRELNLIVETKDVENKEELRGIEKTKIDCAEKFFEQIRKDGYQVRFEKQLKNKKMLEIINNVLTES
ncbi:MAG: type III restriction-modification system endonuclease [Phascolarctobacterium sp.]|nr:MAG: type III restriction-modification system endonuclease [Phascolarctobacterium sp.]